MVRDYRRMSHPSIENLDNNNYLCYRESWPENT